MEERKDLVSALRSSAMTWQLKARADVEINHRGG
jgi:hypothetical protein